MSSFAVFGRISMFGWRGIKQIVWLGTCMAVLSVDQQIAALRPSMGYVANFHYWLFFLAATGIAIAVVFWHPVPLMFALFFVVIGLAERQTGPNIFAAVSAYDAGEAKDGEVSVSKSCWDSDTHYWAVLSEQGHPDWKYEFVPQGWTPVARNYPAKIWRDSSGRIPVLAAVDQGIMIPRSKPIVVESRQSHSQS